MKTRKNRQFWQWIGLAIFSYCSSKDVFTVAMQSAELCSLHQVQNYIYGSSHIDVFNMSSAFECCAQCQSNSQCQAFTFKTDEQMCYLKDNVDDRGEASDHVSGYKYFSQCSIQLGLCLYHFLY